MKKSVLLLAAFVAVLSTFTFTSCSEDDKPVVPPMTGVWKCTGISGSVAGLNAPIPENRYTGLFSIAFVGVNSFNYYYRIGSGDLAETGETAMGILGGNYDQDFFTNGNFSYEGNQLTLTSKDGKTQVYIYEVSEDKKTMTLTEDAAGSSGAVETAKDVLNSVLNLFGGGNQVTTAVGIEYTYQKASLADIKDLLSSDSAN